MASPSDSPLFSGPSYFCLLFPFSQWNSEREKAWQVCCPESPKQVVEETLSSVLIWKELGTKPDDVRKEMVLLCPSSVSVGQKNHHSYDTVTNRTRTRSTHFPSTGIERRNERRLSLVLFFFFLPNVLLSAEKREIYSYFFLSFSSCLNCQGSHVFFLGPQQPKKNAAYSSTILSD